MLNRTINPELTRSVAQSASSAPVVAENARAGGSTGASTTGLFGDLSKPLGTSPANTNQPLQPSSMASQGTGSGGRRTGLGGGDGRNPTQSATSLEGILARVPNRNELSPQIMISPAEVPSNVPFSAEELQSVLPTQQKLAEVKAKVDAGTANGSLDVLSWTATETLFQKSEKPYSISKPSAELAATQQYIRSLLADAVGEKAVPVPVEEPTQTQAVERRAVVREPVSRDYLNHYNSGSLKSLLGELTGEEGKAITQQTTFNGASGVAKDMYGALSGIEDVIQRTKLQNLLVDTLLPRIQSVDRARFPTMAPDEKIELFAKPLRELIAEEVSQENAIQDAIEAEKKLLDAKFQPVPTRTQTPPLVDLFTNGQSSLFQGLNGKNTASNGFEDTPFTGGIVRMPSNTQSADTSAVTSPLFGNLGQLTDASGTRLLSADSPVIINANAEGARDPLAVSDLAANMKDAPTIAWAGKGNRKAAEVAQQIKDNPGSNILPFIKFGLGEPEIPMSPGARAAVHAATDSGKAGYTVGQGLPSLRDAVSDFTFGQHGVRYAPNEIVVTTGLKSGLNHFFEGLFNPGERILAPQEGWPSYGDMAKRHGLELVTVGGPKENGFKPTADQIRDTLHEARLAGKPITGLVLNSPNNPSGMAYTRAEYEAIAEVMRRPENQGVKIGLDDMYSGLMYDNKPHVTLAQVAPDLANRIVTGSGASKMFMIPGERVGWLMTKNKEWMGAFNRIQNTQDSGTSYLGQVAAEGAIREHLSDTAFGKKTYMQQYLDQLHNNRAIAVNGLKAAGIEAPNPDGAFYVLGLLENKMGMTMGNGVVLNNDGLFADHAREDWHIAITPFTAFGVPGRTPDGFRMSLANSPKNVQTGINRIGEGVSLFTK
jgi:aspartate aminotransferase